MFLEEAKHDKTKGAIDIRKQSRYHSTNLLKHGRSFVEALLGISCASNTIAMFGKWHLRLTANTTSGVINRHHLLTTAPTSTVRLFQVRGP